MHIIDQNLIRLTTNRTHQITSCSPITNAVLPMRTTETFYTHPFKIINRVDRERHASAHHKQTQTAFARTMVIPICASLRTSTSIERLAFFSTQNTGFLSSTKSKQHTYTINHQNTMPMRNRTRIVAVSPGANDVTDGAAQKQQIPGERRSCCKNTSPSQALRRTPCAHRKGAREGLS
jgi:hypothetical protein